MGQYDCFVIHNIQDTILINNYLPGPDIIWGMYDFQYMQPVSNILLKQVFEMATYLFLILQNYKPNRLTDYFQ